MQRMKRLEDAGDLTPDDALGNRALPRKPRGEISMLGVLHHKAVAGTLTIGDDEPVVDAKRARLSPEQLGKVRFAQPCLQTIGDLDADLGWERTLGSRRGQVHFA